MTPMMLRLVHRSTIKSGPPDSEGGGTQIGRYAEVGSRGKATRGLWLLQVMCDWHTTDATGELGMSSAFADAELSNRVTPDFMRCRLAFVV